MRTRLLIIFLLAFQSFTFSQQDYVETVINEVNIDSLLDKVAILSGEKEVIINGETEKILNRYYSYPENQLAADYIEAVLKSYGLQTYVQEFEGTGENVYAVQTGSQFPEQKYIICGHYDSISDINQILARGADDNASGTAAVLEAARIFQNYEPKYTIIYALWDHEEIGLHGSSRFAKSANSAGSDIRGVINLDMIAYDSNGDYDADLNTHSDYGNSVELANVMFNINDEYEIGLDLQLLDPGSDRSDHAPFWTYDYSAIFLIEDFGGDFNNFYHSTQDRMDKFNNDYYHKMSQLSIATLAKLVEPEPLTSVEDIQEAVTYKLHQNYPNPFNGTTVINYTLPEKSFIDISVYDIIGNKIQTVESKTKSAGNYSIKFDADKLSSGMYFYILETENFKQARKMILLK